MTDKKEPVFVTCPPSMNKYRIPSFGVIFGAGENPIRNPNLMKFMLLHPMKSAALDPMECIAKGYLSREEVAELGYAVPAVNADGSAKLDEDGKPVNVNVPLNTDIEIPEHVPDFGKMTVPELKDWADDDRHPVKYGKKPSKESLVRACQAKVRQMQKADEE